MPRTLRSKSDRALLWYAASGMCQLCGHPLGDDWQADHILPWTATHRTNVHEMQALCANCNRKKGAKMGLRSHQAEMQQVCREIKAGRLPVRLIIVPVTPGGGKSLLPQIIAKELIPSVADRICWVVPRDSLRAQGENGFVDPKDRAVIGHALKIRADMNDVNPSRGTSGYVTTYQAIAANNKTHIEEFQTRRYILILDEVHHVEEGGRSHQALQPLIDMAELVILMTGTLERGEGGKIAWLPYKQGDTLDAYIPDLADSRDVKTVRYTRRDALREQAIIPIDFYHLDGSTVWVDKTGQTRWSPSMAWESKSVVREALYTALNTEYAYQLLDECFTKWRAYRVTHPRSKMLVVAANIAAAKDYKTHLQRAGLGRVGIATSDESVDAKTAITNYKRDYDDPSALDILVTVGMAYEGLDVPAITHLACLTQFRSRPWIEQMFGRLNRFDPKAGGYHTQRGCAYCPDDVLMTGIINAIKDDQEAVAYEASITTLPGPAAPTEPRRSVVTIGGEVTRERASDLQGDVSLDYPTTQLWEDALRKNGLEGATVQQVWQTVQDVQNGNGHSEAAPVETPPAIPPSQEEAAFRRDIEKHIRSYEYENSIRYGTINADIVSRYRKKRDTMTLDELRIVWVYVQSKYPLRKRYAAES